MQSPSHIARAGAVCCATPTRAHLSGASPYLSKLRGRFPLQGVLHAHFWHNHLPV